ncbi:major capsid protein [Xenorhabdus stockiae]|uniref:major capsid protein n=1 Tax=Xenorhabdus stockiae TaxID=351614 RepID=UPI003CE866DC
MSIKSFCKKVALGATLAVSSVFAFADDAAGKAGDVDLSALTNNIGFGGVLIALMAVAGSIITLYAGFAGIKWVLRMVKGA